MPTRRRSVVTRIAHPTDGGPYPLVVLSHGLTGHPDEYTETVPMWASDGFVVASGVFPLTNREVPGAWENAGDVVNQPGDVSFHTATRDERIDSAVIFAGLTMPMPDGEYEFDSGLPLLVLHGDEDDLVADLDLAAYEQAASPKWFVTLRGAEPVPAFTDDESPHDELVTRTVLDFWHGTLDRDAEALDRVTADATDDTLATVQHG